MALAQPVELVLSDVMMPDMDAMWSVDPAYGVRYRDPKDVQQQALDLEFEPSTNRPPDADGRVTVDLDGVLVVAHSDKQDAALTWRRPAATTR